jgi:hypothetical protein
MKKQMILLKLLFPLLVLASCGGPKKPSSDQLKEWFSSKGGNAAIDITNLQTQYTPMKELLGTTLPEGSWMILAKINGKLKEALYQDLNQLPSSDPDAVKSKAFWDKVNELQKDVDNFQATAKRAGVMLPQIPFTFSTPGSIKEIHPPGTPIELNLKLLATPKISDWDYQVLESDASQQLQKLGGQPKEMFYNLPVFGSPEYQASIKPWKDAVTAFEKAKAEIDAFAQAHPTPTKIPDLSDTKTIIPSDSPLWDQISEHRQMSLDNANPGDWVNLGGAFRVEYNKDGIVRGQLAVNGPFRKQPFEIQCIYGSSTAIVGGISSWEPRPLQVKSINPVALIDRTEHEGRPNFLVPNPEDTTLTIKRNDQVWNLIPGFYTWNKNNDYLMPGEFLADFGIAVESISGNTMRGHVFFNYGGKQKETVEIRCVGGIQPTAKEGQNLMYQGQAALQILTLAPLVLIDRSAHQ